MARPKGSKNKTTLAKLENAATTGRHSGTKPAVVAKPSRGAKPVTDVTTRVYVAKLTKAPVKKIASTADARVKNNPPKAMKVIATKANDPMRLMFRTLSDAEKSNVGNLKLDFQKLFNKLARLGESRELSLAKSHLEDACMRAVRHLTA